MNNANISEPNKLWIRDGVYVRHAELGIGGKVIERIGFLAIVEWWVDGIKSEQETAIRHLLPMLKVVESE